ncbi:MAG TPA: hypothetical protein VGI05_15400 [Streptosporangiaceae bacterium]|jgi:hypothetical protein
MTGLPGRSVTTRVAALLSGTAMLAALAALPARPAWASPAGASPAGASTASTERQMSQTVYQGRWGHPAG